MASAVVYALCDPGTGEERYVGQTTGRVEGHARRHVASVLLKQRRGIAPLGRKEMWIDALLKAGREPALKILEQVQVDEGYRKEQEWIKRLIAEGRDLTNRVGNPTIPPFNRWKSAKQKVE